MEDRQKQLVKAYAEATKRLRYAYLSEFHSLLHQVYEEMGIEPRTRSAKNAVDLT